MTDPARQLASQALKAREALLCRDQLIWQMRNEGFSLRQIAEHAGMTHAGVAKVLRRP